MSNYRIVTLLLLFLLNSLTLTLTLNASKAYCDRNKTTITYTPVSKTRMVVKKPTGIFKFMKKTKTYTEEYVEQEENINWKVIHGCCDGYDLDEKLKLCLPNCEQGCPDYANCVEPNLCQCRMGYISATLTTDGTHYCEPICQTNCPVNGRCAAPNTCECLQGYRAVDQQCIPHCSSGCPHAGECIAPEECKCQMGYKAKNGSCIPEQLTACEGNTCSTETEEMSTNAPIDRLTHYEIVLDEHEKIFLNTPTTDDYEAMQVTTQANCPDGFRYYQGECRSNFFASNELDCRIKPCTANAVCLENGTCACDVDYTWHKPLEEAAEALVELLCLSLAEIDAYETSLAVEEQTDEADWLSMAFIGLGVVCICSALLFLGVRLVRRQRGALDVEAKHDLRCEYDNNSFRDNQMVL